MSKPAHSDHPDPLNTLALTLREVSPRGAKLSKEQKQFTKLAKDIEALRARLTHWREFVPVLQNRVISDIEPLIAQFRTRRVQLVMRLSQAIDGRELAKRQKIKAMEIVRWHLAEILADGPDPQLIALYDKYAQTSFEEEQVAEADYLRDMASDVFGLDLDADAEPLKPDALAHLIAEKLEAEHLADSARRRAGYKKSTKGQAQENAREQLARGASQAVREIYRKLASELHPDRELDHNERLRKTTLMQQANEAYANSDLLTLLGLQLQTAQLNPTSLSSLARERLLQYNHLLAEQCQQLRSELDALIAPFAMNMVDDHREITPDAVARALDREARDIKRSTTECEMDIAHFQDIRNLKETLNTYRLGQLDGDYGSPLDEIFFEAPPPPRRRRRR